MIRLRQVKVPVLNDTYEFHLKKISKLLHIPQEDIKKIKINKQSIDARDKNNIFYIYEFDIEVKNEEKILKQNKGQDIFKTPSEEYTLPLKGKEKLLTRPIIVGTGPAGLFASYILALAGYNPLIIERGKILEERIKDVNAFWDENKLNTDDNVQFGEGGAGTFSDGKLNTLIKDKRHIGKKVFEIFVQNGAPEEIMYLQKPHIGTDILREVIKNMHQMITNLGGTYLFETKLTDIIIKNNKLEAIEVNNKEIIPCQTLVLAIGHSARDTFQLLKDKGFNMEAKPFAMGIRIMHEQSLINESQYGKFAKVLPPVSYKLTYTTKNNRGVYSFCMCPGGFVVNASSEKNHLAINGMSNYKRDTTTANSALVVTVTPKDFGSNPLDGINFQRKIESLAYLQGQGNIPLQNLEDYQNNQKSTQLNLKPILKGNYTLANIRDIFPDFINQALLEAIPNFDKKIKGFANPKTLVAAVESRTSSPVRILRDEFLESNIKGIYPAGEGAGYAGGITTSAIDGIKVAEQIISKYNIK